MKHASTLLFGEDVTAWSYHKMIAHIAKTIDTYSKVVEEIAPNKEKLVANLCTESTGNGKRWTLKQAADALRVFSNEQTEMNFLECARMMNQVEAKLFWGTLLGVRKPITKETFLLNILKDVEKEELKKLNYVGNSFSLNSVLTDLLHTGNSLGSNHHIVYRPRPLKSWDDSVVLTQYNGAIVQLIEGKGRRRVEKTSECVVEYEDEIVTDVFYLEDVELNLQERLEKFMQSNRNIPVCLPQSIPSWAVVEDWAEKNTVRFPDVGVYKPNEMGGYLLVLNHLLRSVRVCSYESNGGEAIIEMEILDGTDFLLCGKMTLRSSNNLGLLYTSLERSGEKVNPINNHKHLVSDDVCLVMDLVSPTFDTNKNEFIHPTFMAFNLEKGIQDITQLVDLVV